MILQALAFYLFAVVAVSAGAMVVLSRNPVHSVLWLILTFFNAAGLFILAGAEFLAMLLVVVYVGAVAVLFLFVVMMLDINFAELRDGFQKYLPIGLVIGFILFVELAVVVGGWTIGPEASTPSIPLQPVDAVSNTEAIGRVLYTQYFWLFQGAGMVLFLAMVAAIVLTLRSREGVRRQKISAQVGRTRDQAIEIRKVQPGQGV